MTAQNARKSSDIVREVLAEYGYDVEERVKLKLAPGEATRITIEEAFPREGDFGVYWVVRATDIRDNRKVYFTTSARLNVAILERLVSNGLPAEVGIRGGKRSLIITY